MNEVEDLFKSGTRSFQDGDYARAITHFTASLQQPHHKLFLIYDSRAAAYAKLGDGRMALKDSKRTIEVAPSQWQGYARSARLFLEYRKLDASMTMIDMALDKLEGNNHQRRVLLLKLKADIQQAKDDQQARHRGSIDHISRLPIEIFGEIARLVVQDDAKSVLPLTHVSVRWRDVVRHTPCLWDTLLLTRRRPREKVKLWVGCSQGKIHHLTVRESALTIFNWDETLHRIKWETLQTCTISKWDIVGYLTSIEKSHILKNLEKLDVDDEEETPSGAGRNRLFIPDMSLQYLWLSRTYVSVGHLGNCLRHLTTLVISDTSCMGDSLIPLLEANPMLETIFLDSIYRFDEPAPHITSTLALSHLSCLIIRGRVPRSLLYAHMPQLKVLHLDSPALPLDDCFQKMMEESGIHLHELRLHSCRIDHSRSVVSLMHSSPELRLFEMSNSSCHTNVILESLSNPLPSTSTSAAPAEPSTSLQTPRYPCPALTHLNLSHCIDLQTGSLVRLVRARNPQSSEASNGDAPIVQPPGVEPFSELILDGCRFIEPKWLEWLRERVGSVRCVLSKESGSAIRRTRR